LRTSRRHFQTPERHVRQFELRQEIVAERARRLGFGHSRQIFPTTTALPLELIRKVGPQRQLRQARMIFHIKLLKACID
jgi:hypothetical protein